MIDALILILLLVGLPFWVGSFFVVNLRLSDALHIRDNPWKVLLIFCATFALWGVVGFAVFSLTIGRWVYGWEF